MIDPWTIFWMIVALIFIWSIRRLIATAFLIIISAIVGGCAFVGFMISWGFSELWEKISKLWKK